MAILGLEGEVKKEIGKQFEETALNFVLQYARRNVATLVKLNSGEYIYSPARTVNVFYLFKDDLGWRYLCVDEEGSEVSRHFKSRTEAMQEMWNVCDEKVLVQSVV